MPWTTSDRALSLTALGRLHGALVLACCLGAAQARAEDVSAVLVGPPGNCVQLDVIRAQVAARSERIRLVPSGSDGPRLEVSAATRAERSLDARLDITWPEQHTSTRQLLVADCDEANAALAFLITLALDPTSAAAPLPAAPEPGAFTFERIELGLLAQLVVGPAPGVMPGLGLQLTASAHGRGLWRPALRLSAARAWQSDWVARGGQADFQLDVVRLAACPLGVRWGGLRGQACLALGLGRVRAQGAESFTPRTSSRLWLDLGAVLALGLDLGTHWELGLSAGLAAPWRRDSYAFLPDEFYRTALLGLTTDLWVGARFP